jgi:hypothetical protein
LSAAGHHNLCELAGEIVAFCHEPSGKIRGFLVRCDAGEAAVVPVLGDALPRLQRGQKIWVKGSLQSEPIGQRYPLVFVKVRWLEVLKPKGGNHEPSTSATQAPRESGDLTCR